MCNNKLVHCKKEPYDVYIGRPSMWGNPYTVKPNVNTPPELIAKNKQEAVAKYRHYITNGKGKHLLKELPSLYGKTLGCWCLNNSICHGQVLLELLDKPFSLDEYITVYNPNTNNTKHEYQKYLEEYYDKYPKK